MQPPTKNPSQNADPLIVISGASGFVGRRLAIRAASAYPATRLFCYVTCDDSAYEAQGKRALKSKNIVPVETDLITGKGLIDLARQPSVIFHLAANSATWSKEHSCSDRGTQNFISSFRLLGPGSHVVYTSSIAVMDTREDYSIPMTETTPTCHRPFTDYGVRKLLAEKWLQREARLRGFALSIVRPVTVYGPEYRPNSVLGVLRQKAMKRSFSSHVQWPGKTGFVHVDDLAEVLLGLAELAPPSGETQIYLVQAETRTLADVSRLIHSRLNIPFRPVNLPGQVWRLIRKSCHLALHLKWSIPCYLYAAWWRLRVACENVFWCDTSKLQGVLPLWKPSSIDDRIGECL